MTVPTGTGRVLAGAGTLPAPLGLLVLETACRCYAWRAQVRTHTYLSIGAWPVISEALEMRQEGAVI